MPATTRKSAAATQEAGDSLRSAIRLAAQNGRKFYVYSLADAEGTFYIGKGQRNRVFNHGNRFDSANPAKNLRIAKAQEIKRTVLAYFTSERAALKCERELIASYGGSLTNIMSGGSHQDPRERAIAIASEMLVRLGCREQYQPHMHWLYDSIKTELEREAADPTPTSFTTDRRGQVIDWGYA